MNRHEEMHSDFGNGKKTLRSYVVGFGLSLLLTCAAFYSVGQQALTSVQLFVILSVLAITQLLVQSMCFLRLNNSAEGRWNLFPFLFSILIIAILVSGTLWIMYNLNFYGMS